MYRGELGRAKLQRISEWKGLGWVAAPRGSCPDYRRVGRPLWRLSVLLILAGALA